MVGGGLAGITAALDCLEAGFSVRLCEARPRLGGATYSFTRGDLVVDTGQHVLLRCYTTYLRLLERLGVGHGVRLQQRFRVPVLAPGTKPTVLTRWNLPAPAHLAPALLGYRRLNWAERARLARTALALRGLDPADPALDEISLGQWLRDRGETPRAVDALWGLLGVAALNAEAEHASMALAAKVFRTGVLDASASCDIGVPQLPLGDLHGRPGLAVLRAKGADVRLRCKARAIRRTGEGLQVSIREPAGETALLADHVVLATPHTTATQLVADLPVSGAHQWERLSAAPIVNIHAHFDRRVTDLELAAVLDSPVQWVFDRTRVAGAERGQYLAVSQSAAHREIEMRTEDIRENFVPALRELFPAARRAQLLDFFVTREPSATFQQGPGTAALRPAATTDVPGLVLAGAWTATGWPDTTEGAVRSGALAARAVQEQQRFRRAVEVTA